MKKTQIIDLLRNIRKDLIPFISIALFVALGIACYTGFDFAGAGFLRSMDKEYKDTGMQDVELVYHYGFADEDIEKIAQIEGVEKIEGSITTTAFTQIDDRQYNVIINSITDRVNSLRLIEGELPDEPGEIAVNEIHNQYIGVKIGDVITLKHDDNGHKYLLKEIAEGNYELAENKDQDGMRFLNTDTFKVTGIVQSSYYMFMAKATLGVSAQDIPLDAVFFADESTFDKDAFNGYTNLHIIATDFKDSYTFSDEYIQKIGEYGDKLLKEVKEIINPKSEAIRHNIEEVLALKRDDLQIFKDEYEGITELIEKGELKIRDGEKEILNAQIELSNANKEIADGEQEVANGRNDLIAGQQRLKEAEESLALVKKEFKPLQETYESMTDFNRLMTNHNQNIKNDISSVKDYLNRYEVFIDNEALSILADSEEISEVKELLGEIPEAIDNGDYSEAEVKTIRLLELDNSITQEIGDRQVEMDEDVTTLKAGAGDTDGIVELRDGILKKYYDLFGDSSFRESQAMVKTFCDWYETLGEAEEIALNTFNIRCRLLGVYFGGLKNELNPLVSEFKLNSFVLKLFVGTDGKADLAEGLTDISNYTKLSEGLEEQISSMSEKADNGEKIKERYEELSTYLKEEVSTDRVDGALNCFQDFIDEVEIFVKLCDKEIKDGEKEIADGYERLVGGKKRLEEGISELERAKSEYGEAEDKLISAKKELSDKKKELSEAKEKITNVPMEIEDAEALLKDFEQLSSSLRTIDVSVSPLTSNPAYSAATIVSTVYGNVKLSMTLIFVLVGMFVTYSAVSRNVYEQTIQIGTKKALGLFNSEILRSVLSYSGLSCVAGVVSGSLLGVFGVEQALLYAMNVNYNFARRVTFIDYKILVIFMLLEFMLIMAVGYFAGISILKKPARVLLAGQEAPKIKTKGFERSKLWRKLTLLQRTIINNLLSDKRRVFATLVGVAGCTALIVSGLLTIINVNRSDDYCFKDLVHIGTAVYYDTDDEEVLKTIHECLNKADVDYVDVRCLSIGMYEPDGVGMYGQLIVGDKSIDSLVNLKNRAGESFGIEGGIYLPHAQVSYYDMHIGDVVKLYDNAKKTYDVTINGEYEYYLPRNTIMMSADRYEETFDKEYKPNVVFTDNRLASREEISELLKDVEGIIAVYDYEEEGRMTFKSIASISNAIGCVYLFLSLVMAVLVVYNLLVMHVKEKRFELIVMMINGFSRKMAKRYIYVDTIFLTVVGIVVGCVVGCPMGINIIKTFCSSNSSFLMNVSAEVIIGSALITSLFTYVMSVLALKEVNHFCLSDINR